jgi:hypothetical protein
MMDSLHSFEKVLFQNRWKTSGSSITKNRIYSCTAAGQANQFTDSPLAVGRIVLS